MEKSDEKDVYAARVACLSGILDLQRVCQKEKLAFSAETNQFLLYQTLKKVGPWVGQKLISKLVEKGKLFWEENEDYDVEQIVDHANDEGVDYYLIKWKGWNRAYNSWEPKENLNCPELLEEFHFLNDTLQKKGSKRPAVWDLETEKTTKKRRLDELWEKLNKNGFNERISPLELMSASSPQKQKGLLSLEPKSKVHSRLNFRHMPRIVNKKRRNFKEKKHEVEKALKDWERKLNSICADPAGIVVENTVDLEGPPDNFEYINDYRPGEGIEIPQDPLVGCECIDCFQTKKSCCPANCGTEFAYYKGKKVRVPQGTPIYECNKRCHCGPECPNRVVQQGRKCKVSVFRTSNGRGWGVKTLQRMKKGTFVMEYVGEVITNEEAERRGKVYDAEGRTYLFDLDYNDGDCPFTVDAGYYGNVSHFINHSCDPNLVVYGVWINTMDPRLPRIALFSGRDIDKGEELTFDYMMTGDTTQKGMSPIGGSGDSSKSIHSAPNSPVTPRISASAFNHSVPSSPSSVNHSMITPITPLNAARALLLTPKGDNSDLNTNRPVFASPYSKGSASPKSMPYRMVCQCGAKNCRKYLF